MFNPFSVPKKIFTWYSEGISPKAKAIIVSCILLFFAVVGFVGYKINDYFENDPNACIMCHVHDAANRAWAKSVHKTVGCHQCHYSTKKQQVIQMYKFAVLGVRTVSPRHGAILVAWQVCYKCHWEGDKKYPNAPNISHSPYHAKHVFIEKIECTKCHGYITHEFVPTERFCVKCHTDKKVHGTGMEKLPCLNCHTDTTKNLKPDRKKCLFCHGSEKIRKELIADGTIDVRYFQPSQATIKKATKINTPDGAPMQFYCYECHDPHKKVLPDVNVCLKCHSIEPSVGKHGLHIKMMNMKCMDCHKPHVWRITPAQAKVTCVKCHEYRDPKQFLK